ncbi:MAG: hypothetical protein WB784_10285 [Rhodanobacteraceae bacterium]
MRRYHARNFHGFGQSHGHGRAMVGSGLRDVNQNKAHQGPPSGRGVPGLPASMACGRLAGLMRTLAILTGLLAAMLLMAAGMWFYKRRLERRTHLLGEILDLADSTELTLRECRDHLDEIQPLVAAISGSGADPVRATATAQSDVQAALCDLLGHRLWLKAHAADANLRQLRAARNALAQSLTTLTRQLELLAGVRDELDRAGRSTSSNPDAREIAGSGA